MKKFFQSRLILLILTLGLVVRLISINQSLWLDEAIGALVVKEQNYRQILTQFPKSDNHPPLYYLTLKAWTDIFGYSEISLRMPSVIFGVLTIWVTYLIGKSYSRGKKVKFAEVAALLIATSQFHIYYSQEARMYSLAAFLAAVSFFFFLRERWIPFSILLTALVFTDYVTVFLLPVFWVYALSKKLDRNWWIRFGLAHLPLSILGLLWLPMFLQQAERGRWLLATLPGWKAIAGGATLKQAILVWMKFVLGRVSFFNKVIYYSLVIISSIPFIIVLIRSFIDREKIKLLWIWLLLPLLLGFGISFWFPAFIYFRFTYIIPAFYLVAAWGVYQIETKKIKIALLLILLLVNLSGWFIYLFDVNQQREEWRQAVKFVEIKAKTKDAVIFDFPEPFAPYRWYARGTVSAYGATDSISASLDSYDKTKKLIAEKEGVYYFEYLYDLTDPNRYVEKSLIDSEFKAVDQFSQFPGIGTIIYYKRQ